MKFTVTKIVKEEFEVEAIDQIEAIKKVSPKAKGKYVGTFWQAIGCFEDECPNVSKLDVEVNPSEIKEVDGRYRCSRCGYEFSAMMGESDVPNDCPNCGEYCGE